MKHPTPAQLLELHFEEMPEERRVAVAAHVDACAQCRDFLADLVSIEEALDPGVDQAPPADGLERVLARVGEVSTPRRRREARLRAVLPSVAAVGAGAVMVQQGGLTGGLVFFLGGALVTLALAPILILESQRRTS